MPGGCRVENGRSPRIVDDHGADLHGGVKMFIDRHPETDEVYDIKHLAACLLKARLEKDERWKSFASQSGLTSRDPADRAGVPGAASHGGPRLAS